MPLPSHTSSKLDLKKHYRALYTGKVDVITSVHPGRQNYLRCTGRGDPNLTPAYAAAVEALFATSYAIKFDTRRRTGVDYGVMPLEGLWWSEDPQAFTRGDRSTWLWTMMILQPDFVTASDVERACAIVATKRKMAGPELQFEAVEEGPCAQTLHVGPFLTEGPTIAALHAWIETHGHSLTGKHHEIYLSNIRRVPSSRWKTLLRQPYR